MFNRHSGSKTQALSTLFRRARKVAQQERLSANTILAIGAALRHGWITPEHAVDWLVGTGLIDRVTAEQLVAEDTGHV